jgi:hypothetical protein
VRLEEQELDTPAAAATAEEARGEHARVVQDQEVAREQELGQIADAHVPRAILTDLVDQEACLLATRAGRLRDALRR